MTIKFHHTRSVVATALVWLIAWCAITPALAATKTTLSQGSSDSETTFVNRRALVGHSCMVSCTGSGLASVLSVNDSIQNICDETLTNTAYFTNIIDASVAVQQLVGVKDLEHYYAAGTVAGFLVTSSKTELLGANVADMFAIWFYRDGKVVDTKAVKAGQDASLLNVSLIQIGSKDACQEYTATSEKAFDEIRLVKAGALVADVAGTFGVKYAFVGNAKAYKITQDSMKEYASYVKRTTFDVTGRSSKIGTWSESHDLVDNDTTNVTTIYAVASLISSPHPAVAVMPADNNEENDESDTFKEGTTIGFKFLDTSVLKISAGVSLVIELYDHNNQKVETHRISTTVLGIGLLSGQIGKCSVVAGKDFSRADISVEGVASISVGGIFAYYAYVILPPSIQSADDTDNDLVLKEETTLAETDNHSKARLIFRRNFNDDAWNSLILPVNLSQEQFVEAFGSDAQLSKFSGVVTTEDVSTLMFQQVSTETDGVFLAKNTPYIIYLPEGNSDLHPSTALYLDMDGNQVNGPLYIVETDVDFDADDITPSEVTSDYATFTGSYNASQALEAGWYVFSKGNLYHTTKTHTQKAYRCWLTYDPSSSSAKETLGGFGVESDGTTAIYKVLSDSNAAQTNGQLYNLNGQKISSSANLQRGIYLKQGKKFIVK